METVTRRLVNRVEGALRCRIVKLDLEFVEYMNVTSWLVRSTKCLTVSEKIQRYHLFNILSIVPSY